MTRAHILLALTLTLTACGAPALAPTPDAAPEPIAITTVRVDAPELAAFVDFGVAWWQESGAALVRDDTCDPTTCTVVQWAPDGELPARVGGITPDGERQIRVNPELRGGASWLPPGAMDVILSHELGHALGKGHVPGRDQLMRIDAEMSGRVCIGADVCRVF